AADDPSVSDFIHPAIINIKDTLFIAISTKGASPAMARVLRMRVEDALKDIITDEDLAMIKVANYARNEAINRLNNTEERKRYLYEVINNDAIKTMIKNNKLEDAKKEAIKILERWS
ncbi:MAG: bifunctional precorrin-2 dehydrogenase/sirohydrochlorin ferrochelatase, partial [Candidatus Nitrosothermus koennekii]